MSDAEALVRRLFGSPGGPPKDSEELLGQAGAAHAGLLYGACAEGVLGRALDPLLTYLRGPAPAAEKRRFLCHPLFIEGLHGLAPFSAELRRWHDVVAAPPEPVASPDQTPPAARASLGHVAFVFRLRGNRRWQGEHDFCTDVLGRLGFPFSDWSLTLHTTGNDILGRQGVTLALDGTQARWRLADGGAEPFLVMSRDDCLGMVLDNDDSLDGRRLQFPDPRLKPRLHCARPLGRSPIRYDPVAFQDFQAHAGITGGLVERLVAAVRRHSPGVYRELRTFLYAVRGFEFPTSAYGVVGSFSDPTLPGVMGVNFPYTPRHQPCADPCCFTWFGHELGHTKHYLIDTILHGEGLALMLNPAERTEVIPRYGRAFSVRTLFQIPYVHLYEWALLMDFWQAGFRGLPWRAPATLRDVGEDLAAEIREAFTLIRERARLTAEGAAALGHLRELFGRAQARWRAVRRVACP
jgi:hypothetical protein